MISKVVGLSLILLLGIAPEAKADRTPLGQLRNGYYSVCRDELVPNDSVTPTDCFTFRKLGNRVIGWHYTKNVKYTQICLQGEVRGNTLTGRAVNFMIMTFGEAQALEAAQGTVADFARRPQVRDPILHLGNPAVGRGLLGGQPHITVNYRSMIFDSKSYKYLKPYPAYEHPEDSFRKLGESGDCRNA